MTVVQGYPERVMASQDPRSYVVRTFGCQMNDHDSERISGLLDADGLVAVEEEDDADVVVLNTCCIRENADNKLYGNLGMLKRWKDAREAVMFGEIDMHRAWLQTTPKGRSDVGRLRRLGHFRY